MAVCVISNAGQRCSPQRCSHTPRASCGRVQDWRCETDLTDRPARVCSFTLFDFSERKLQRALKLFGDVRFLGLRPTSRLMVEMTANDPASDIDLNQANDCAGGGPFPMSQPAAALNDTRTKRGHISDGGHGNAYG